MESRAGREENGGDVMKYADLYLLAFAAACYVAACMLGA